MQGQQPSSISVIAWYALVGLMFLEGVCGFAAADEVEGVERILQYFQSGKFPILSSDRTNRAAAHDFSFNLTFRSTSNKSELSACDPMQIQVICCSNRIAALVSTPDKAPYMYCADGFGAMMDPASPGKLILLEGRKLELVFGVDQSNTFFLRFAYDALVPKSVVTLNPGGALLPQFSKQTNIMRVPTYDPKKRQLLIFGPPSSSVSLVLTPDKDPNPFGIEKFTVLSTASGTITMTCSDISLMPQPDSKLLRVLRSDVEKLGIPLRRDDKGKVQDLPGVGCIPRGFPRNEAEREAATKLRKLFSE